MSSSRFRERVIEAKDNACLICGRSPKHGYERRQGISVHHVNGDDTDDRVTNGIPVCQSCHIHIHRTDEPPYRKWHRQLKLEHRNVWNQYTTLPYEGPRLTRAEAEARFGEDGGTPESVKYLDRIEGREATE